MFLKKDLTKVNLTQENSDSLLIQVGASFVQIYNQLICK